MIPYGNQNIAQDDIDAVVAVLKSSHLTQGPTVREFEAALCDYTSAKYAQAMCNATAALHAACLALDVTNDDIVWTSPNTFVASANCARYCGAKIDFVDIDSKTGNICINALNEKLKQAKTQKELPKVLIPVHFAGQSCDMEAISQLSKLYGFKVIEDASHALGGKYNNLPVGSGKYSDITVFSFHPVKMITTGEGGAALTNDQFLFEKIKLFANHGIERSGDFPGWYYQQTCLGYNFRMPDINAALGLNQLKKVDHWVFKRNEIARFYKKHLQQLNIEYLDIETSALCSYHLFVIKVHPDCRKAVYEALKDHGIGVQIHYIPVHTQPDIAAELPQVPFLPNVESYYERCISLPIFPHLTIENREYVMTTLAKLKQLKVLY